MVRRGSLRKAETIRSDAPERKRRKTLEGKSPGIQLVDYDDD